MTANDWFGAIGAAVAVIALVASILAAPHFVSYSRVKKLVEENKELKAENVELNKRCNQLMMDCEFWREKWRDAQQGVLPWTKGK